MWWTLSVVMIQLNDVKKLIVAYVRMSYKNKALKFTHILTNKY